MNLPKIYFIPGLGADQRVFTKLKELGLEFEVIEFIEPIPGESLPDYALRLSEPIDKSQPFILGGMSLGGIMTMEIAKVLNPELIIIISSVTTSREFPFYFQTFRYLPLHRILPAKFLKRMAPQSRPKDESVRFLLKGQRRDADPHFIKWAIGAVVHWRNKEVPEHLIRLHGTRDLMFPGILCGPRTKISKGTHVMVLSKAQEVHGHLMDGLKKWQENFVS